ncbi:MAG: biotin transporter BioY [Ruminococcus sp.]|nr:biotin transporter BioY [Ruminococcus sp.]MCM1480227.1 biotin transporter BioY [Muribaculaceae bacterium]
MKKNTVYKMALCGLFAALTAVCSWITIPTAVPFTLQTFAVFCALGTLGGQWGTVSVLVYLLLGFAGVPVFAGFSGGYSALFTPSGGFLLGFIATALVYRVITAAFGEKPAVTAIALVLGLIACYAVGTAWFVLVYAKGEAGVLTALTMCVFPFVIPDAAKIAAALVISARIRKILKYEKTT